MKNDKKIPNVPNLRFPEFKGEWERYELKDIAAISKGSGISKDQLSETGHLCILYGELYTKYKSEIIDNVLSRTNIDPINFKSSKTNDVIIPSSGETAIDIASARCVAYDNILLGGDLNIIRLHDNNGVFLSYQLNGVRKNDIARLAQGVSVIHLYGESLKKLNVSIPTNKEQEKIANFISLLDQRISTQSQIIKELKSLKIALRNDLYRQIAKNEKAERISNLLNYEQPTNYIVANTNYSSDNSLTPVLTANKAFILGYTDENYGIYDKGECVIFDDFTMDLKYVDFPFKVKSSAIKILTARPNVNLRFIYEYLSFLKLISSDHKRHYISEVEPMHIHAPEIEIQNRIANMLSSFDKKIDLEINQYDLLVKQKKYLLANMFT